MRSSPFRHDITSYLWRKPFCFVKVDDESLMIHIGHRARIPRALEHGIGSWGCRRLPFQNIHSSGAAVQPDVSHKASMKRSITAPATPPYPYCFLTFELCVRTASAQRRLDPHAQRVSFLSRLRHQETRGAYAAYIYAAPNVVPCHAIDLSAATQDTLSWMPAPPNAVVATRSAASPAS